MSHNTETCEVFFVAVRCVYNMSKFYTTLFIGNRCGPKTTQNTIELRGMVSETEHTDKHVLFLRRHLFLMHSTTVYKSLLRTVPPSD